MPSSNNIFIISGLGFAFTAYAMHLFLLNGKKYSKSLEILFFNFHKFKKQNDSSRNVLTMSLMTSSLDLPG